MKYLLLCAGALLLTTGCDVEPTHVFASEPSNTRLEGVWTGTEQISTVQDNMTFSFPVVLQLDADGRFTLFTSNYPASYSDNTDRTCSGVYTRSGNSIAFYPRESCRALPLTSFTLGRVLPGGITMEARTSSIPSSMGNYVSIRVLIRLDRG